MIQLEGYLEVPPERMDEVMQALVLHIELTKAEPGCISFSVEPMADMPGRFAVAEQFVDQTAFDHHQSRSSASAWAEASAGLERNYEIKTV